MNSDKSRLNNSFITFDQASVGLSFFSGDASVKSINSVTTSFAWIVVPLPLGHSQALQMASP